MIVVVAGVSGTGKTSVGQRIATQFNLPFFDADDFHPQSNIDKMASGQSLNDDDRWPWLEKLAELLANSERDKGAVLACSALKESYRELLSHRLGVAVHWVFLTGSFSLLSERLSKRENHFFDGSLLQSQLDTLELPAYGIQVDVSNELTEVVTKIIEELKGT